MMNHKNIALIPAAGMGKRMGASINKQYLELDGVPIVARTIKLFENSPFIDSIYLVIPEAEITYCREYIVEKFGFKKVAAIVPGGKERQNSVLNGLCVIAPNAEDHDIILIHDGVRPLVTKEILLQSIDVAIKNDGALVAVPVKDTIKTVQNGIVTSTPDRQNLWQAQTPQSFRFDKIYSAHKNAASRGFIGTDDASLVEWNGGNVRIVNGNYTNIKITTPEDLILAEAFLAASLKD